MDSTIIDTPFTMPAGFDHAFLLFNKADKWLAVIETEPPNKIRQSYQADASTNDQSQILDWIEYTMAFIRFYSATD